MFALYMVRKTTGRRLISGRLIPFVSSKRMELIEDQLCTVDEARELAWAMGRPGEYRVRSYRTHSRPETVERFRVSPWAA